MVHMLAVVVLAAPELSLPPPPPKIHDDVNEYPRIVRENGQVCMEELSLDHGVKTTCRPDAKRASRPALQRAWLDESPTRLGNPLDVVMEDGMWLPGSLERLAESHRAFEPATRAITQRSLVVSSLLTAVATTVIGLGLSLVFATDPNPRRPNPFVPLIAGPSIGGVLVLVAAGLELAFDASVREAFRQYSNDPEVRAAVYATE